MHFIKQFIRYFVFTMSLVFTVIGLCLSPLFVHSSALASETSGVGFVYIDAATVSCGQKQSIVVALDNEQAMSSAKLVVSLNGEEAEFDADKIVGDSALFSIESYSEGEIRLVRVEAVLKGSNDVVTFALDSEDAPCLYQVSGDGNDLNLCFVDSKGLDNDSLLPSVSYVVSNDNGSVKEYSSLSDAAITALGSGSETRSAGSVVIVLDPGHGGYDSGCSGYGLFGEGPYAKDRSVLQVRA